MREDAVNNARRRLAIPERRDGPDLVAPAHNFFDIRRKAFDAGQLVAAYGYSDWPLGIWPQSEAGSAEKGAFLLQPARVGEYQARPLGQTYRIVITDRIENSQAITVV